MTARYALRTGEHLAISSDAIRQDADGIFLSLDGVSPDNETKGSVVLVHVRGALQQFASPYGDSYEAIVARVGRAFAADPAPSSVVLRISSPGGVVAGLNEAVTKLQRMSKAAEIRLIAYVDELAASAAYALCCACSEVLSPLSGVCGSIGVISTMVSVAKSDEKSGVEFRIITSGKRKADGHLHVPFTDDAVKAEAARNTELAAQFFELAGKARKVAPKKLESLQAAIYLGKEAKRVGLVDDVIGLDAVLLGLDTSEVDSDTGVAKNQGNVTDRRAKEESIGKTPNLSVGVNCDPDGSKNTLELDMSVRLDALMKTAALIAAEKDPKKLATLQASFAALASAGGDDDDEPPKKKDDDDDDDDESKAKKAAAAEKKAKAKAEASKHRAKAAEHKTKAAESEELAKKAEEEDDEEESSKHGSEDDEANAALRLVESLTGMTGGEALGAMRALATTAANTARDVAALKAAKADSERASLIESIKGSSTKDERTWLATQATADVRGFVKMRLKSGFVNTSEDALIKPEHRGQPGTESSLPKTTIEMIDQACEAWSGDKTSYRAALVKAQLALQATAGMNEGVH